MRLRGKQFIVTAIAFLACVALATGLAFARGGGHGGGHGGHHGGHHGSHHHGSHDHHASHHSSHHHNGHHGGYGGYGGWGGGYGGYAGYGGYGYDRGWGVPAGGWGNYAADEPISVPIAGLDGVNDGASYNNQTGSNAGPGSEDQLSQNDDDGDDDEDSDEMASNDKGEDGDDEDNDVDYRGAIQLVLPSKDAHVFLNGKLVLGVGTRRLMLTPEIEDENKPEKFHVLAVWEENGRPKQREADVELTAGGGIALNLAKEKPTESALPAGEPGASPARTETAESDKGNRETPPAAAENATEKLTH